MAKKTESKRSTGGKRPKKAPRAPRKAAEKLAAQLLADDKNREGRSAISSRVSRVKSCSLEELEAFLDKTISEHGGKAPITYSEAWELPTEQREQFNAMFMWIHENIPFEFSNHRRLHVKMDQLASKNLYHTEKIAFNCHVEGLWLSQYYIDFYTKQRREKEKEQAPPHPIVAFIMKKRKKKATFKEIQAACPEIKHLHSYLHYLVNKKGLLTRDGDVYSLKETER